jgi:hypothetical protein
MTRAMIEDRLKVFEERLVQQTGERERVRGALAQMEVACHQLAGAIAALRELAAELEPPEEPMA